METETVTKHTINHNEIIQAIKDFVTKKTSRQVGNVEIHIRDDFDSNDPATLTGASVIEIPLKPKSPVKKYKEDSGV